MSPEPLSEELEKIGLQLARAQAVIRAQADELVYAARRIRELETQGSGERSHSE
jgi:hypothetical protein